LEKPQRGLSLGQGKTEMGAYWPRLWLDSRKKDGGTIDTLSDYSKATEATT
jgi:hypothetical protein